MANERKFPEQWAYERRLMEDGTLRRRALALIVIGLAFIVIGGANLDLIRRDGRVEWCCGGRHLAVVPQLISAIERLRAGTPWMPGQTGCLKLPGNFSLDVLPVTFPCGGTAYGALQETVEPGVVQCARSGDRLTPFFRCRW
jgi:hypothetical protein